MSSWLSIFFTLIKNSYLYQYHILFTLEKLYRKSLLWKYRFVVYHLEERNVSTAIRYKSLLKYSFQVWTKTLSDIQFVTLRTAIWYNVNMVLIANLLSHEYSVILKLYSYLIYIGTCASFDAWYLQNIIPCAQLKTHVKVYTVRRKCLREKFNQYFLLLELQRKLNTNKK